MVFTIINKKDWSSINDRNYLRHSTPGISGNARKKDEHFLKTLNLKTFIQWNLFSIYKNSIFHLCPNVARFFKNSLYGRIRHLKKKVFRGREFRGGSDEKMRKMWLGRDIVVVNLPPLVQYHNKSFDFKRSKYDNILDRCNRVAIKARFTLRKSVFSLQPYP